MQRLDALIGYCEASSCRRRVLLSYFGEDAEPCGNCDICLDPSRWSMAREDARCLLDVVRRTGERYGATHIVDVLRGAETEKIAASGHNRLRIFGVGFARKKDEWRSIIRQLVAGGFLDHDVAGFGGLSLSEDGQALLRGEKQFQYRLDAARGSRKERIVASSDPLTAAEESLLAALKKLRLSLAAEAPSSRLSDLLRQDARSRWRAMHRAISRIRDDQRRRRVEAARFRSGFLDAIAAHRATK